MSYITTTADLNVILECFLSENFISDIEKIHLSFKIKIEIELKGKDYLYTSFINNFFLKIHTKKVIVLFVPN